MDRKDCVKRTWLLVVIAAVAAVVFIGRLYSLNIVHGADYLERATKRISRTEKITAPRGEISDRFGRPLVTNRMSFSVSFDATTWDKEKRGEVLRTLISLCEEAGQEYTDTFPVSKTYPFSFAYGTKEGYLSEKDIAEYVKKRKWEENPSAERLVELLAERFGVESEDKVMLRNVVGVLLDMELCGFSKSTPYTFAHDADRTLVTRIKEHSRNLPGVLISVEPIREYKTSAAAHLLGRVGIIYKEEYADYREKGYKMTDLVGKEGIEKAYESYLRGVDGSRTTETTSSGKTTTVLYEDAPVVGKNCFLTIDLKVQEAAEKSLAEIVPKLRREGNQKRGGINAKGAALVAVEVKTGGLLAMASYPTFDITQYNVKYKELSSDPLLPLFNRAISGTYPPGSTFKMITAYAALKNGIITPKETMQTKGKYMYYAPSVTPKCDIFRQYGKTHGTIDVSEAIKVSCNYFFYDVGRRVGIDLLSQTARSFGLGEKEGIEIDGEVKGIVASREYREERGKVWYPGETLSAAIGQSDTMVTPLQLANYVAQLVNRGVRYKPHLLKSVREPDTNEEIVSEKCEVAGKTDMPDDVYNAIIKGLHAGAQESGGTSYAVFGGYPISVGGKTGSAEAPGGSHAVNIAFAPVENPEIAVAVIVENGGQGSRIASVARDVFDAYFASNFENAGRTSEGVILS